mgnify:CR=1 FL=1
MSGARFVRFYPSDWRSGCIGLTPEEEGVYMRVCAHFWETGVKLPLSDADAASRLMLDVRMWRRIKAKLVSKGKLHVGEDGIFNPRAERELTAANRAAKKDAAQADLGTAWGSSDGEPADGRNKMEGWDAGEHPVKAPNAEVETKSPRSRPEVAENFDDKINEINGSFKEPVASSQGEEKRANARGRSESFWSKALGTPTYDGGVHLENGRIVLADANREFWLDEFDGDGKALDLALIRAAGYVQPASSTRLRTQVDSQLARIVADRRDQTKRYEASKAERQARSTSQGMPRRTLADALRDRVENSRAA